MANSSVEEFQGKIKYIHAAGLNKYDKWSVTFYPDPKALERIRDLQADGLKNVIKKDDDNQYFIQFSREPIKKYLDKKTGMTKEMIFSPPKVKDHKGAALDGNRIGRGSDCKVLLELYWYNAPNSSKKVVAARFEGVIVDNLVPYETTPPSTETKEEKIW